MADNPIGTLIGDETYQAQKDAGDAFLEMLPPNFINLPIAQQQAINAANAKMMAEIMGLVLAKHAMVWERVTTPPTAAPGLDRPVPSVAQQYDSGGSFVAVWLKYGAGPTEWRPFDANIWEQITFDPSIDGLNRTMTTIVWEMDGGDPNRPIALWTKNGPTDKEWSKIWPVTNANSGLITAYTLDFTALPSQDLKVGGDGLKTIAGKNWNLSNNASVSTAKINDGVHSGLYLRCNSVQSENARASLNGGALYISLGSLASILGLDGKPQVSEIWVWVIATAPHAPVNNFEATNIGLIWSKQSYTYGGVVKFSMGDGYNSLDEPDWAYGRTQYSQGGTDSYGTLFDSVQHDVWAFRIMPGIVEAYQSDSVDGQFPAINTLRYHGRALITPFNGQPGWQHGNDKDDFNLWFSLQSGPGNSLALQDLLVKRIRIDYMPRGFGGSNGTGEEFYSVNIVDGVISGFGSHRELLVHGGGTLYGVDTSTCGGGTKLHLTFAEDTIIAAMGSPSSGAPIKTPRMGDTSPIEVHALADDDMEIQLRTDTGTMFWKTTGGFFI